MATNIYLDDTTHKFVKQNLVTQTDAQGPFDTMRCSECSLEGKRRSFAAVTILGKKKVSGECPKAVAAAPVPRPLAIRITECKAFGPAFVNVIPGSVHAVVDPPAGKDEKRGYWVMGVGEPVLVLFGEYEVI